MYPKNQILHGISRKSEYAMFEIRVTGVALVPDTDVLYTILKYVNFKRNNFWLNYFAINCRPDGILRKNVGTNLSFSNSRTLILTY